MGSIDYTVFLTLLRAGLWEQDIRLSRFNDNDYKITYQLAQEQSVVGLITAGIEHIKNIKVSKHIILTFVGDTLQIEQRNSSMNSFIQVLDEQLQTNGIHYVLLKGQGIAQCYERPLWRTAGDIDFFFDELDFEKAKRFFRPLVKTFDPNSEYAKSINMHYDPWTVEIHANQHSGLSSKIDIVLDDVRKDIFIRQGIRIWNNGDKRIELPSIDNDVILVFCHILKHLYKGGIGIRQICDWIRLLWANKNTICIPLLERRLKDMRLCSVWKVFASLAVHTLGMSCTEMPLYDSDQKWKKKSQMLLSFIMTTGNMGHNRDTSYYGRYPYIIRKWISFIRRMKDVFVLSQIFPYDSIRFLCGIVKNGIISTIRFAP